MLKVRKLQVEKQLEWEQERSFVLTESLKVLRNNWRSNCSDLHSSASSLPVQQSDDNMVVGRNSTIGSLMEVRAIDGGESDTLKNTKTKRSHEQASSSPTSVGRKPIQTNSKYKSLKGCRPIVNINQLPAAWSCQVAIVTILASLVLSLMVHCQTTTVEPLISPPMTTISAETPVVDSNPSTPPASLEPEYIAPELANLAENNNGGNNKLKPINFTLVNEIFESALSDDEVVKRWKHMDSQLRDGMKSILKMVFPQIVAISQDAKVSGDCSGGILKWILSLRNLRSWAIKMLDATGKPTAGVFEGSLTMFGNYRQCLSIRAPDEDEIEITEQFEEYFRGQFCVLHLKPWMPVKRPFYHLNSTIEPLLRKNYKYYEKTLYDELAEIAIAFNFIDIRMDLCVPSTCTTADIQRVADLLSKTLEMRAKVMRCDIQPRETIPFYQFTDRTIYLWLALPLTLIVSSLMATLLLSLSRVFKQNQEFCDTNNESKFIAALRCMSIGDTLRDRLCIIPTTGKSTSAIGSAQQDDGGHELSSANPINHRKPLPLYGLRNLFIFWFIIVQMTMELKYQYLRESLPLRNMIISYWPFQIIVNSVLLFESLIIITAFTFSYTCLECTLKNLIGYIIDKYIRLIPSIITLIAITITTPLIAIESPVWRNFVEEQATVCKSTGYIDLFFLQNFISYDKICLPHTWLFCVELQLIALSIPLVLLLKRTFLSTEDSVIVGQNDIEADKNRSDPVCLFKVTTIRLLRSKVGLLSLLLIIAGMFINFFVVYTNNLPPSWFYTFPDVAQKNYYFGHYLAKTWTHLSAFILGLLAGHICRSAIQLRNIKLLKSFQVQASRQHSPNLSSASTSQSHLTTTSNSHGSTSTIMAMELSGDQQMDHQSASGKRASKRCSIAKISFQLAALICMSTIIFSTFTWSTQETPSALVAALYDASSRIIWSLALVGLMIQLCLPNLETNKYSSLARLLSHPICILMGRLSFLAYLLSPYIHTFVLAVEEQSMFPSLFLIFHVIVGNIVITYAVAFILAIVIEQPTRRLISRFALISTIRSHKLSG